jgi:hypothetical protein
MKVRPKCQPNRITKVEIKNKMLNNKLSAGIKENREPKAHGLQVKKHPLSVGPNIRLCLSSELKIQ